MSGAVRPLHVYVGMIAHETNSFSPIPTDVRSFQEDILHRRGDAATAGRARRFPGYGDALAVIEEAGDEPVAGFAAWTQPSAPAGTASYEALRTELLNDLRSCGPCDVVLLNLHGAMLAEGYDDCEADILDRVRALVGPDVPIGAILDLHGNVGPRTAASGALLAAVKEYPHTDYRERTQELYRILVSVAREGLQARTLVHQTPVLGLIGTTEEPMRNFVEDMVSLEGRHGVLMVSMMHGFPWSDTPNAGAAALVIAETSEDERGASAAAAVASRFAEILRHSAAQRLPLDAALDAALEARGPGGPVVVADCSDNPGGGAAGDSTPLLAALLQRQVPNCAVGMLWDPLACDLAAKAGVGSKVRLRIGGKTGPMAGPPLDVEALVTAVRDDARQPALGAGRLAPLGLAVALRIGEVEVVLNSVRQQVFSPECFRELGIPPEDKDLIVVKSSQHFRAAFDPIAVATIYCDALGLLSDDISKLPYRRLRRPIWPLDAEAGA